MVFVLIGVSVVTFSLMHIVPGDPAEVIAIERYGDEITNEIIAYVRKELGFDRPVYMQYFSWAQRVLQLATASFSDIL